MRLQEECALRQEKFVRGNEGERQQRERSNADKVIGYLFPREQGGNTVECLNIEEEAGKWEEFTKEEIVRADKKIRPKNSPEPDHIQPEKKKTIAFVRPEWLLNVVNSTIQRSELPRIWKKAESILLPKPNKGDVSDPAAYRPLCLLSPASKLMGQLGAERGRQ